MCPSYMVTREEKHSTRGRAHLLFEMLQRRAARRRLARASTCKEALDLCLACKGCKSDCPVNVDMATYKAEFLVALLRGPAAAAARLRVRADRLLGAARRRCAPGLANFVTQTPGLRGCAKAARRHRAAARACRRFAPTTFQRLVRAAGPRATRRAAR